MSVDCRDTCLPNSPNNDLPPSILAPLIDAISTCIHSIHQALDIICSIEPDRLISLPTVALARTSYPVVSLIKIYSLIVASNTHVGQVIDMNSLKIEYYLEKVITHYRAAAARDGGRAASKFGNIIMMLRNWFIKKRENGPALREIFGTEMQSDTQGDKQAVSLTFHLSKESSTHQFPKSSKEQHPSICSAKSQWATQPIAPHPPHPNLAPAKKRSTPHQHIDNPKTNNPDHQPTPQTPKTKTHPAASPPDQTEPPQQHHGHPHPPSHPLSPATPVRGITHHSQPRTQRRDTPVCSPRPGLVVNLDTLICRVWAFRSRIQWVWHRSWVWMLRLIRIICLRWGL